MKTSTHKEALKILKPMHSDFEKYMFEPEIGGYIDNDFIYKLNGQEVYTLEDNKRLRIHYKSNKEYHIRYIPTLEQLWQVILKFNEEPKDWEVYLPKCFKLKEIYLYTKINAVEIIKPFRYTDTNSMYLALLKVCVEIWKIKQGVK